MNGETRLLRACRREAVDRPPVWFMRQAGRSLPEYRALRERHSFRDVLRTPELAVEATLQPVRRFGMDGAILFSDILVVAPALGIEVEFAPGPVVGNPVRDRGDAVRLRAREETGEAFGPVLQALRSLREELAGRAGLIGFAGGPFTVASYLVEERPSRDAARLRTWLRSEPEGARLVLEAVADLTAGYLRAQAEAGAQVLQVFDTRAGVLAEPEFRVWALPWARRCVEAVRGKVPVIYMVLESGHLLEAAAESGADVIGVDWKTPLGEVRRRLGPGVGVQGNLDPASLFASPEIVSGEARRTLEAAGPEPGHVFNLGHGVLPDTPLEGIEAAVEAVWEWRRP